MVELETILRALTDKQVDFVIIGGVAIAAHGSAYVTRDLDFAFKRSRENAQRIVDAMSIFNPRPRGFPESLPYKFEAGTLSNGTNFTFKTDVGDVDMLGEVAGVGDYEDVEARSVQLSLLGCEVKVLNLDGLIAAKRAAARTKDLLVLPELEALREALNSEQE